MGWAIILLLVCFLVPVCVAWLTSLSARPFRFWIAHPWKAVWASYLFLLVLGAAFGILGFPHPSYLLTVLIFRPLLILIAVFSIFSAVHGLRVTWKKSHKKAVFLIFGAVAWVFLASLMNPLTRSPAPQPFFILVCLGLVAWWVLTAVATDYLARRLVASKRAIRPAHETISW